MLEILAITKAATATGVYLYARSKIPERIVKNTISYEHCYHSYKDREITLFKRSLLNSNVKFVGEMDLKLKPADFLLHSDVRRSDIPIPSSYLIKYFKYNGPGYEFTTIFRKKYLSKSEDELELYIARKYMKLLFMIYLVIVCRYFRKNS